MGLNQGPLGLKSTALPIDPRRWKILGPKTLLFQVYLLHAGQFIIYLRRNQMFLTQYYQKSLKRHEFLFFSKIC